MKGIALVSLATPFLSFAALGFGVGGCSTSAIRSEEVPAQPIAFAYFDPETARRRAEELEREEEQRGFPAARGRGELDQNGVAPVAEMAKYLQRVLGLDEREAAVRFQGRLALLGPRTGRVTVIESARRGAIPQDWSPDRDHLLFSQVVRERIPHLYELEVATGNVRRLTDGREAHPEGCYGPDGSIVYTSVDTKSNPPQARIMLTRPGGGDPLQLSLSEYAYYPSCAPDGSAVAYTEITNRGRDHHIVVRSPVVEGTPRIVSPGKEPSFSADGEWLVFSAKAKDEWTIWRIRPNGTGRAALGRSGLTERRPSLSPDSRFVVYVAVTDHHPRLYLRRIDGSGDRIFLTEGDGDRPVW